MLEKIAKPLLAWYDGNARILPWRENPSPYRIWVSEIMLQQTRVEAVKPFFERFTGELTGIPELAACPQDRLLKLWEGLGYYNRVRNMQKAAQIMVEKYGGRMPEDYDDLLKLPGIGPYTAGAVASIAFGIPVPAVDGNVLRVLSRVTAYGDDILKQSVKTGWEKKVREVMPQDRPGDFNQALMELGALVCVPNGEAKCAQCPLQEICIASKEHKVTDYPRKMPKKSRKIENRTVLIIRDGNRAAIRKRPEKGLLAGLYELPNLEGHLSGDEVLTYLKEKHFLPLHIQKLEESRHIFSHIEWHMTGYIVRVEELEEGEQEEFIFVEPKETEKTYPIPAAFGAYVKQLRRYTDQTGAGKISESDNG
ncbi:MAG: A/G-specific adenine glycosylase [Blautia sp.]|nr:A/G-specific adenine glycosylase [Blautia sp.]MDY4515605.1 A/G-specific adenine glycosylase [Lachnospiraceae bacterium]